MYGCTRHADCRAFTCQNNETDRYITAALRRPTPARRARLTAMLIAGVPLCDAARAHHRSLYPAWRGEDA